MDFGISKVLGTSTTCHVMGTPSYMIPEHHAGQATFASDQWALGAMLYQLATGQLPFDAESERSLMWKVCNEPAPMGTLRPDIPAAFQAVIQRTLRKQESERFPSVRVLGFSLLPFASPRLRQRYAKEFFPCQDIDPLLPPPFPWRMMLAGAASAGVGLGLLSFGVVALAAHGRCVDEKRPWDVRPESLVQGAWTTALGGVLLAGAWSSSRWTCIAAERKGAWPFTSILARSE